MTTSDEAPPTAAPATARPGPANETGRLIGEFADSLDAELIEFRRDLHAHPELARAEVRTTHKIADRLRAGGLAPRLLANTGLVCDVGPGSGADGPPVPGSAAAGTGAGVPAGRVALRADLDALPVADTCALPWASTVTGVAHACGHDVHAAVVLGAGLVLARLAERGRLRRGVRLIFQPAEEVQPGGSLDVIAAGALDGVDEIYAVHCEPKLDVGLIGTRIGPVTSAADAISVTVSSAGGHTSRPHLTGDVVYALGQVITQLPAVLGRRLDPRSGVNLTWGAVQAGNAHNAIPATGTVRGTLRCLDVRAWELAGQVLHDAVDQVVAPYGVEATVHHVRGVPPVDNEPAATLALEEAARDAVGLGAVVHTEQSLGGEDFAWYLTKVRGALARLGTRTPGGRAEDIHRGDLTIDERAIGVGVRLMARLAAG